MYLIRKQDGVRKIAQKSSCEGERDDQGTSQARHRAPPRLIKRAPFRPAAADSGGEEHERRNPLARYVPARRTIGPPFCWEPARYVPARRTISLHLTLVVLNKKIKARSCPRCPRAEGREAWKAVCSIYGDGRRVPMAEWSHWCVTVDNRRWSFVSASAPLSSQR